MVTFEQLTREIDELDMLEPPAVLEVLSGGWKPAPRAGDAVSRITDRNAGDLDS